jgi:hypothetical protein
MRILGALKALFRAIYMYSEIRIAGTLYMRRWRFMPDWMPGFRVHCIMQSDDDRALHDHPFHFLTFILKGGYYEYLADGSKTWHGPGSVLWRPAKTAHRIDLKQKAVEPSSLGVVSTWPPELAPAWTLVFRSRYFREWGFHTKAGWIHNSQFIQKREGHHSD